MDKVLSNIAYAVSFRDKHHLSVDLGSQFVLLSENRKSLVLAVKKMKEVGVDFIAIKPFVLQNPLQYYQNTAISINEIRDIIEEAKEYEDENFKVVFRENAFRNIESKRSYQHCRGCNFTAVLNSAGDLATCLPYWDKQEFVYGNIYKESFQAIWNGQKRARIKQFLEQSLDCSICPTNCHPNAINEFLEEILNPSIKHKNFI
ncbi:MAG: SPASM domain-containing protein [Helicobacter sp.]|nr:SPASM domain-containing protein [Helicobacter sp.]